MGIRLVSFLVVSIFLVSGVVSVTGNTKNLTAQDTYVLQTSDIGADLSGKTVGIYESYSPSDPIINESRTALVNMFTWMNASVIEFNTSELLNGVLWACEILAIPEGLGPLIENELTDAGEQAVREWVACGGSYIGVRGSASITVTDSYFEHVNSTFDLGLINGTSIEVTDLPAEVMTNVSINRDCIGPDLSDMPENLSVLFETGRYFVPHQGQNIICIANYTHRNLPAIIAAEYGEGNVFISSPHFEYEENSDRDGTEYMDEYDDPDSEWPLLLTIARWLVDSSPTVANVTEWPSTNTTDTGFQSPHEFIAIGGGLGVVIILAIVIVAKRR